MKIECAWAMTRWVGVLASAAAVAALIGGCGGGDDSARKFFDAGAEQYQAGNYDRAVKEYEQGLEIEPNSAVGYNLLGMAYRMKYNTLRASEWKEKEIAAFTRAVETDSTYWPARINLGATLYYMGEKEQAARQFRRALQLHPDNPERKEIEKFIREGGLEPPR